MREDAEYRVRGEPLLSLQEDEKKGERDAGDQRAEPDVDSEEKSEGNAEQGAVRHRVPEIGHAPPDDEAAQRATYHCDAGPAEEGAPDEVFKKNHRASPPVDPSGRE